MHVDSFDLKEASLFILLFSPPQKRTSETRDELATKIRPGIFHPVAEEGGWFPSINFPNRDQPLITSYDGPSTWKHTEMD